MIDNLALGLSHGLMLLAAWRLLSRADLDDGDAAAGERKRHSFLRKRESAGDA